MLAVSAAISALVGPNVAWVRKRAAAAGAWVGPAPCGLAEGPPASLDDPLPPPHAAMRASNASSATAAAVRVMRAWRRLKAWKV